MVDIEHLEKPRDTRVRNILPIPKQLRQPTCILQGTAKNVQYSGRLYHEYNFGCMSS
jgi:hypothetical protein